MADMVFNKVDYTLGSLISDIKMGQIGLPDLQRPFVWKNSKIRDLFDSLFRGYPVGYLLFWRTGADAMARTIGTDLKQLAPDMLIVDGQQRLTAVFAVTQGRKVIREDYSEELIEIAFSPLDGTFEVADAAIRKDPRFIANVSGIWASGANLFDLAARFLTGFRKSREQAGGDVTPEEINLIQTNLHRLSNLMHFPLTALVLDAKLDEEQVAEVFVRINSKGKALNQSDFILTLMSVFWEEGRQQLEKFCRAAREPAKAGPSPFNRYLDPLPDQLLRVAVGVGFRRARLQHVYSLLRGKDLTSGVVSPETREKQFAVLQSAQQKVLDLQNWHDFLSILPIAGYRGGREISSRNALLMAYILYLVGRRELAVDGFKLKNAIARWFFMSSLTGRYAGAAGAPETSMERDLVALRGIDSADQFLAWLDSNIDIELTSDFWSITLPNRLNTSAARSPALFGYLAALVILDAKVLFSNKKVEDLLDPSHKGYRKAVERHHLFPKRFLKKEWGISSTKEANQIANMALVEWEDNALIAAGDPRKYAPEYAGRFKGQLLADMYYWHALPSDWANMEYEAFLKERRRLMAKVTKDAFQSLGATAATGDTPNLAALLSAGEGKKLEYKSTLRLNLHSGQHDPKIEHSALKTLAAFLNGEGGTLLIGVSDSAEVLGIESDGFGSEDKMTLHLVNLVKDRMGAANALFITTEYLSANGKRVLAITCHPSTQPVFLKDGPVQRFYVRTFAATTELVGSDAQHYITARF